MSICEERGCATHACSDSGVKLPSAQGKTFALLLVDSRTVFVTFFLCVFECEMHCAAFLLAISQTCFIRASS